MDGLDELTDDQLRVQLLKYGLSNFPITGTTKRLLIKKLRLAIDDNKTIEQRKKIPIQKKSGEYEDSKRRQNTSECYVDKTKTRASIRTKVAQDETYKNDSEKSMNFRVNPSAPQTSPKFGQNLQNSAIVTTSYETKRKVSKDNNEKHLDKEIFRADHKYSPSFSPSKVQEIPIESQELLKICTPLLSSFAQRLSSLRAEPLDTGMNKYKFSNSLDSADTSWNQSLRRSNVWRKNGFFKNLAQVFDSLDSKYNFRKTLCIVVFLMIIVAMFVILL